MTDNLQESDVLPAAMGHEPYDKEKQLFIDRSEVSDILAPFLQEQVSLSDSRWRQRMKHSGRRWRTRAWKRRVLGRLPGIVRTQTYVRSSYEETWSTRPWPVTNAEAADPKPTFAEWEEKGLILRRGGLPRVHLQILARTIASLRPRRVLEVGAGTGVNLFVLASMLPDIEWTGVELTKSGVAQARGVQKEAALPALLADYCPGRVIDPVGYRNIRFLQGDATALDFESGSFDLVLTRQALEQMNMIKDDAVSEISRVAQKDILLCEPFKDFNDDPLRRDYVYSKNYFSMGISDLQHFGIRIIAHTHRFPQNIQLGIGIVQGRVG